MGNVSRKCFSRLQMKGLLQGITEPIKNLGIAERKAELKQVYVADAHIADLNERRVLLIDDVVTTGTTACAIIGAILDAFPRTRIEVFALAWTPTPRQQLYLGQQKNAAMLLNDREEAYGGVKREAWVDEDFESGETNVSV